MTIAPTKHDNHNNTTDPYHPEQYKRPPLLLNSLNPIERLHHTYRR